MQSDSSPLPGYQGCRVDWQPSSAHKVMLGCWCCHCSRWRQECRWSVHRNATRFAKGWKYHCSVWKERERKSDLLSPPAYLPGNKVSSKPWKGCRTDLRLLAELKSSVYTVRIVITITKWNPKFWGDECWRSFIYYWRVPGSKFRENGRKNNFLQGVEAWWHTIKVAWDTNLFGLWDHSYRLQRPQKH